MNSHTAVRPAADEFVPYYGKYIALVPDHEALPALERQRDAMLPFLRGLSEEQGALRYAPGKWSIKQMLEHVADGERVFAYRALRFGRGDETALPGFDENQYAAVAGSDRVPVAALVDQLEAVRAGTLHLFRGFDDQAWTRRGSANSSPVTVRALAFIIAGHGYHHMKMIRERYLSAGTMSAARP
jgi:hypothetical protein